jgi:hypothetical protein
MQKNEQVLTEKSQRILASFVKSETHSCKLAAQFFVFVFFLHRYKAMGMT